MKTLIVVDVQKGFCRYYKPSYLDNLKKALDSYDKIVTIVDDNFETLIPHWLQEESASILHKSYGSIDIDDYLKNGDLEEGETGVWQLLPEGLLVLEVPNGHENFVVPAEMQEEFNQLEGEIHLVGGADGECLEDIEVTLDYLEVTYETLLDLTYNGHKVYKNYYADEEYWVTV